MTHTQYLLLSPAQKQLPQFALSLVQKELTEVRTAITRYEDQYKSAGNPEIQKDTWGVLVHLREMVRELNKKAA